MTTTNTTIKPLTPEMVAEGRFTAPEDRIMRRFFLSPTVAILLLLSIFPLIWSLGISFTDIQRGSTRNQAQTSEGGAPADTGVLGLGFHLTLNNYARMAGDAHLWSVVKNTLVYVVLGVTVQYVIGFGLAYLLNQDFFGRTFFRTAFLLPMMITPVAAAYTGRMMFDSFLAPLAQLLRTIATFLNRLTGGNLSLVAPWLTDPGWAPFTMVLIDSWQWIPFMTLILLAGLQAIPEEIYEAARVDGATARQIFFRITFPIMLPISITAILIRGLEIFKIVDIIRVTTGGGPGIATESLVLYVYNVALTFGDYGYAAAISYVLLVLVILFTTVFLTLSRRVVSRALGA